MKKRVTVITLQNIRNYGSVLQALATQEVMESIGLECNFVDYWIFGSNKLWRRISLLRKGSNIFFYIMKIAIFFPSFLKDTYVFNRFNKKYLHLLPGEYTCENDLKGLPITSDIYCTGSDQTWNSAWNQGIKPEFFLSFVPDNVKKISYAASIGKNKLDDWEVDDTRTLLNRYSCISVREKSAVDICEGLGIKATQVLDPTLQVSRDFWMSIASPRRIKERYVLVYQLNTNHEFDKYAVEYAKRKGCKLVRFCVRHYQALRPGKPLIIPNPEDFISAIAYADTVITDSFHATAFCSNLHVPMICIYPHEFSSRLASILNLLGLEDRHLMNYNDFRFCENEKIDFNHVDIILEEQRKIGIDFLRKAMAD